MLWMKLILNYKSVACDETKLPYEKKKRFPKQSVAVLSRDLHQKTSTAGSK